MHKKRDRILYLLLLAVSVAFIFLGNRITAKNAKMFIGQTGVYNEVYLIRVDSVLDKKDTQTSLGGALEMTETKIKYSATILFGERKGDTIVATQSYDTLTSAIPTPVKSGDWYFAYLMPETSFDYITGNMFRLKILIPVALVFFALLIVFGRFKGLSTIIALGLSVLAIFVVFVPAILSGMNVYLWAFLICFYSIGITPFFIGGFNKKSVASAFGCVGGVAVAAVLTAVLNQMMKITGAVDEETMMVSFILEEPIDLRAITFAAILIGALGATLDVSMSIASAMSEMYDMNPKATVKELTGFGMNIGRDIIGTQISTLVLAYIGGSMSVVLLLVAYQNSVMEMLNLEIVIIELFQSLIGGFTILFTIPTTAVVSGLMFAKSRRAEKREA